MSESESSKVFLFDGDDPDVIRARAEARRTFKYFWREMAWERRRIVPWVDLACVKAPFSDGGPDERADDGPRVEEMWVAEVDFDGRDVTGELLNSPNWVTSVEQGDAVRIPFAQVSDWMYVTEGQVFGAHTVQLLRSRMNPAERAEHDAAWGLDFGDPAVVRLTPESAADQPAVGDDADDHPMSVNMAPGLREQVARDPSFLTERDDGGWTILHHFALAGSTAGVRVLLELGADPAAETAGGMTPADLARTLGWDRVVALLEKP